MDFIQGEKFFDVGDFTYAPNAKLPDDYYNLKNTVEWNLLKDRNIIYTHTMYVKSLFDIISLLDKEFIIITHNSDYGVGKKGILISNGDGKIIRVDSCTIPDNVIKWYSQNVAVSHPRIKSIPIGLENTRWVGTKKEQMLKKMTQPRDYKNLLYMNHSISTNPKQRQEPYDLFEGKDWVTAVRGHNGLKFDDYIDAIYNHKFVLSPQGNGIDCHRTWEALYMGSIPIEKRNINNQFYTDLPILFVDEWSEITKKFLDKEYKRIKNSTWNMDKLNFNYWKNKILTNE